MDGRAAPRILDCAFSAGKMARSEDGRIWLLIV
jgi:hypothetical protein